MTEKVKKRGAIRSFGTMIKPEDYVRVKSGVDKPMLIIIIMLLCFGTVMVFSSSYAYALEKYDDSFYYITKQLIFLLLGGSAMFVIAILPIDLIRGATPLVYIISLGLLAAVPIYGIAAGKAVRWIWIGSFTIQPSEIMKPALVMMLAFYISRHQSQITDFRHFWTSSKYGVFIPTLFIIMACVLIVLENHFSGTIIVFLIGMIVIFCGGARMIWFGMTGGAFGVGLLALIMFTDYARKRIDIWLHPENYSTLDDAWQTTQGLNAVGSGGFFGVGLGNSRQKHMFVSQPQNDFIFSIIAEELGFIGAILLVGLFIAFVLRGIHIAKNTADTYSSLVACGIVGHVALQFVLNLAVVLNMIPNTGITLPFFSYGGSSLIILMAEMGVLLCVSRYSYVERVRESEE